MDIHQEQPAARKEYKSLYEQLKAKQDALDEANKEAKKSSERPRGLDEEDVAFLEDAREEKRQRELAVIEQEQFDRQYFELAVKERAAAAEDSAAGQHTSKHSIAQTFVPRLVGATAAAAAPVLRKPAAGITMTTAQAPSATSGNAASNLIGHKRPRQDERTQDGDGDDKKENGGDDEKAKSGGGQASSPPSPQASTSAASNTAGATITNNSATQVPPPVAKRPTNTGESANTTGNNAAVAALPPLSASAKPKAGLVDYDSDDSD